MMVDTRFRPAESRVEAFRPVRTGTAIVGIAFLMIHSTDVVSGILETIPGMSLVTVDRSSWLNDLLQKIDGEMFVPNDDAARATTALPDDHHDAAFSILISRQSAIPAILAPVRRLYVSTNIDAVDFDLSRHLSIRNGLMHPFAELMLHDESRLMRDVE